MDFQQPTKQWQSHAEETFAQAVSEEQELNALRKRLLHDRRERINAGQEASPDSITAYADILNNFERIGDYALRVNENILGMRADEKVAAQETAAQPKVA